MNLQLGSNIFREVSIPVLWGTRAIVQDRRGKVSVIDLSGKTPTLEVLGDRPAPGIDYTLRVDGGFTILSEASELYAFDPKERRFTAIGLRLPELEISDSFTRVGTNTFSRNVVVGFGVGIRVSEDSISMGAPLPEGLARLEAS